ncbi:MAG: hypothetical protein WKF50_10190 [Nocardioides sp.]
MLTRGTVRCEFDSGETAELLIPNDIDGIWLLIELSPETATSLDPGPDTVAAPVAGTVLASDFWDDDVLVLPRFDPDPARCFAQMITNFAVLEELGPAPLPDDAPVGWIRGNWVADLLTGQPIRDQARSPVKFGEEHLLGGDLRF